MTELSAYIIGMLIGLNIGSAITRLIYEYTNEKKGLKASKSLDELYERIYDHHCEISLTEDSEYKRGLLSLSNWVLNLMTSNFNCEYKAEINPHESEEEDETTKN